MSATLKNEPIADWRLWWFAQLESALDRGDSSAAREALGNLERLGVEVRFLLPPPRRKEEARARNAEPAQHSGRSRVGSAAEAVSRD